MDATADNFCILNDYISGSKAISATQAAKIIAAVVHDACSLDGASQDAVNTAKLALNEMCKKPSPAAIPSLLSICQHQISFDDVDVFVLSSAAWKAIVAASLQSSGSECMDVCTKFRVVSSAVSGAENMIRRMAGVLVADDGDGCGQKAVVQAARLLKIARFHSFNAARCAKVFANALNCEQGVVTSELIAEVLRPLLEVIASVTLICYFDECASTALRDDMNQNISPALGATLRSVLLMILSVFPQESDKLLAHAIPTALGLFTGHKRRFGEAGGLNLQPDVLRVLAVMNLMRLATSDSAKNATDGTSEATALPFTKATALCRSLFCGTLVPCLFKAFYDSYVDFSALRESETGIRLVDMISAVVGECATLLDSTVNCTESEPVVLDEFLYAQISSSNSLNAFVASEVVLCRALAQHETLYVRNKILIDVLSYARTSLLVAPAFAEQQWMPLAGKIAASYVREGRDLRRFLLLVQESASSNNTSQADSKRNLSYEPFTIRLIATLCKLMVSGCSDLDNHKSGESTLAHQSKEEAIARVLDSTGTDQKSLTAFIKKTLLANFYEGSLAEAAILLLPHMLDSRAASGAALACIKRQPSSTQLICGALNSLSPASMSSSAMKAVCTEISTAIRRHGVAVCVPTAAFVARASMSLHENVSLADWQEVSTLLERAIVTSQEAATRTGKTRDAALCAVVMFHAASTLSVTGSIPMAGRNRNTHATLPQGILPLVEDALARSSAFSQGGSSACGKSTFEREWHILVSEGAVRECPPVVKPSTQNIGPSNVLAGLRDVHTNVLRAARELVRSPDAAVRGRSDQLEAELRDIRVLLGAVDACTAS